MRAIDGGMAFQGSAAEIAVHADYRADIDGLRAIAVLGVLVYHAFPQILTGGFTGVDVFFVISGFLITRAVLTEIASKRFSIGGFYARRARRLFPALAFVLVTCLLFGWHTLLADDLAQLGKHIAAGVGFVANLVLWSESGYFDAASTSKPLLHLWSLGIEEQFYLAWPLLLLAAWRLRLPLLPVIFTAAALSLAVSLHVLHGNPTAAFYAPFSRAWELIVGALLAVFCSPLATRERNWFLARWAVATGAAPHRLVREYMAGIGLTMLVGSLTLVESSMPFPGFLALLPTVGTALLIGAGPATFISRRILSSRAFVWIGLISYPLYLWHWPVLTFARNAYADLSNLQLVSLLLVSVVLAWLTWRVVERPLRSSRHGGLKVTALLLAMASIGGLGLLVWKKDGYPSRYPQIIQRATEYDLDAYRLGLRNHVCFMDLGASADFYAPECVDPGEGPLWVLWGDSAAASLYPGIRGIQQHAGTMRLAQFTSSACPPILDFEGPNEHCAYNNRWALDSIAALKPDTVVLAAMWQEYDLGNVERTVARIKAAGVKRVVLLGPPPAWKDTPSRITFNLWRDDPLHVTPPARLDYSKYGAGPAAEGPRQTVAAEAHLRAVSENSNIAYISLVDAFCNAKGCLTREDSDSGETFFLDIYHLTPAGSHFAAGLIEGELLGEGV